MESQTYFHMARCDKISLALNEADRLLFNQIQACTSEIIKLYANQPMKNHRGSTPNEVPLS